MLNIIINASNTSRFSRTPCNLVHSLESIERSPLPRPKFPLLSSSPPPLSLVLAPLHATSPFDIRVRIHGHTHVRYVRAHIQCHSYTHTSSYLLHLLFNRLKFSLASSNGRLRQIVIFSFFFFFSRQRNVDCKIIKFTVESLKSRVET